MINKQKTGLLIGAIRLHNEQKRFGHVRDIDSDIFARPKPDRSRGESEVRWIAPPQIPMYERLLRQFYSMSLREKNKVRRLQETLDRQPVPDTRPGIHYESIFSPHGQKIRSLTPGVKLLIKRHPLSIVQILTVEMMPEVTKLLKFNVRFSSGITGDLYIVTGEQQFDVDAGIHLNELINLNRPTIEDILWCDKASVNIQSLLENGCDKL